MPSKGVPVAACRGSDGALALSGAWAFRFETASTVSGTLPEAQGEVVTRYGVALLCQDGLEVDGFLVACALAQTPLLDDAGECAAQMPGPALLASLPISGVRGALDQDGPGAALTFDGFQELWGLEPGADLPEEGAAETDEDVLGVTDPDDDGAPGVTLRGDGEVPTVAWAVRRTRAVLELSVRDDRTLVGTTQAETDERVLGGPAGRVLSGRVRAPASGDALFVRADGLFGSPRLDADRDGVFTCAELGPFLFGVLPAPPSTRCP